MAETPADLNLYMRYLGALRLLEECSPHVGDETRDSIEQCFADACAKHPLKMRRILNRLTIEVRDHA